MNNDNASLNKSNKEGIKLDFVPFENRLVKKEEIEKRIFRQSNEKIENNKKIKTVKKTKNSKKILIIIISLLIFMLFILSSLYNEYILYGTNKENYRLVNKFSGICASIDFDDRPDLLRKIGFDDVKVKTEKLHDKNYVTTYAYHQTGEKIDSINVYYDEDNKVKYVMLELNYKKENYNTNILVSDSNAIISNFFNVYISKNEIKDLISSNHVLIKEKNIKITYDLSTDENYYTVTISLE